LQEYKDDKRFHDECELLTPIIEGARIIYVVDASKPYSDEYEMEMEILRYSGTPSMAILNYISNSDYTEEWNRVLGQYFRLIKRFNPLKASREEHIDILEALVHLDPIWSDKMKEAVKYIKINQERVLHDISEEIAKAIKKALSLKIVKRLDKSDRIQKELQERFKREIEQIEKDLYKRIKNILHFKNIEIDIKDIGLEYELFSEKSKEIFGLKKEKLMLLSTIGSALSGGAIDLAVGGHSFFLGTILGGVVGLVGSMYGYEELAKIKFISDEKMQVGPIKDVNFGFIFLNRAIFYAKTLLSKSHADRKNIKIDFQNIEENILILKKLNRYHERFSKNKDNEKDIESYTNIVLTILKD